MDDPFVAYSIEELTKSAEVVVRGVVTAVREDVIIGTDVSLRYSVFTVEVKRDFNQSLDTASIDVAMSSTSDKSPVYIPGRPLPSVNADGFWMLTKIDPSFGLEAYVLQGTGGFLLVDERGQIANDPGESHAVTQALELGSAQAVQDTVTTAARQ